VAGVGEVGGSFSHRVEMPVGTPLFPAGHHAWIAADQPRWPRALIVPSQARNFLQSESPCRARASHPPVSSLGSGAESPRGGEQDGLSVDRESYRPLRLRSG